MNISDAKQKRRMVITSKRPLALLILAIAIAIAIAIATASGVHADGGDGGGGVGEGIGGECDAENADGSCYDASSAPPPPPAAPDEVEAKITATGTDDDASPPSVVQVAECVDKEPRCAFWASEGECEANPDYMLRELRY